MKSPLQYDRYMSTCYECHEGNPAMTTQCTHLNMKDNYCPDCKLVYLDIPYVLYPSLNWIEVIDELPGYPWFPCPICNLTDQLSLVHPICNHYITERAEAFFGKEVWQVTKEILR